MKLCKDCTFYRYIGLLTSFYCHKKYDVGCWDLCSYYEPKWYIKFNWGLAIWLAVGIAFWIFIWRSK